LYQKKKEEVAEKWLYRLSSLWLYVILFLFYMILKLWLSGWELSLIWSLCSLSHSWRTKTIIVTLVLLIRLVFNIYLHSWNIEKTSQVRKNHNSLGLHTIHILAYEQMNSTSEL
jgi:NADH:ubiquinone oxidoreductase subunit 6 (subunit J)